MSTWKDRVRTRGEYDRDERKDVARLLMYGAREKGEVIAVISYEDGSFEITAMAFEQATRLANEVDGRSAVTGVRILAPMGDA